MITEQTIKEARTAVEELRQRGESARAQAIEALIDAVHEDVVPALDLLTTTQTGNVLGVSGQTIKNWVRDGRFTGYRVGSRIMIPKAAVEEYVRRAAASLELEDYAPEDAARLVAEGRSATAKGRGKGRARP